MAMTMYLETTLKDMAGKAAPVEIEAGALTYERDAKQLYLTLEGQALVLDDASGRQPCEASPASPPIWAMTAKPSGAAGRQGWSDPRIRPGQNPQLPLVTPSQHGETPGQ